MLTPHTVYSRGVLTVNGKEALKIDKVSGIEFYECPIWGDEAGLWAVFKGEVFSTDYFHAPDEDEIGDPQEFADCYQ